MECKLEVQRIMNLNKDVVDPISFYTGCDLRDFLRIFPSSHFICISSIAYFPVRGVCSPTLQVLCNQSHM